MFKREDNGAGLQFWDPFFKSASYSHWGVITQRADTNSLLLHRKDAGFERSQCMSDRIRIIKHEAVPGCGSFEVRGFRTTYAAPTKRP